MKNPESNLAPYYAEFNFWFGDPILKLLIDDSWRERCEEVDREVLLETSANVRRLK